MPRAYLRLDPGLPDHKGSYPDGALAAFVVCLCLAEQQPKRGYFRSERLLRVLLEKRARWIRYLVEHEDLILQPDGSLYFEGWHEWQEGDVTVYERVRRIRGRRAVSLDTAATVTDATAPSVITPLAEAEAVSGGVSGGGGGGPLRPPAGNFVDDVREQEEAMHPGLKAQIDEARRAREA